MFLVYSSNYIGTFNRRLKSNLNPYIDYEYLTLTPIALNMTYLTFLWG